MNDRICITMPQDDIRDFLIAAGIAQDYQVQLIRACAGKKLAFDITIRMQEKFRYFEPILKLVQDYTPEYDYSGWTGKARREYDCFIDFDLRHAWDIGECTKMHLADAWGTMCGIGLLRNWQPKKWPHLNALQLPNPDRLQMLVVPYAKIDYAPSYGIIVDEAFKFCEFVCANQPEFQVGMWNEFIDFNALSAVMHYINRYAVVVGPCGLQTYIAASLGKAVIEIFKDQKEFIQYNNHGLRNYKAVMGPNVRAEVLFSIWEELYEEESRWVSSVTTSDTNYRASDQIQAVSTVGNAEGK